MAPVAFLYLNHYSHPGYPKELRKIVALTILSAPSWVPRAFLLRLCLRPKISQARQHGTACSLYMICHLDMVNWELDSLPFFVTVNSWMPAAEGRKTDGPPKWGCPLSHGGHGTGQRADTTGICKWVEDKVGCRSAPSVLPFLLFLLPGNLDLFVFLPFFFLCPCLWALERRRFGLLMLLLKGFWSLTCHITRVFCSFPFSLGSH